MDFATYQTAAESTEIHDAVDPVAFLLLGIVGEAGVLTSGYKKHLRDRSKRDLFVARARDEIGDLLWYASALASRLGLSLDDIAQHNLRKAADRWQVGQMSERPVLDANAPEAQQFPRQFLVEFQDDGSAVRILNADGEQLGDVIDDNSHTSDGYRHHDVFHLANAAVLGWSPTARSMMKRKRKYDDAVDRIEDGARAVFTEEGIVAVLFRHAEKHGFYEGVRHVESELLAFIRTAVTGLEVEVRPGSDWEAAILQGFDTFRSLRAHSGGIVRCDLDAGTLTHLPRLTTSVEQ